MFEKFLAPKTGPLSSFYTTENPYIKVLQNAETAFHDLSVSTMDLSTAFSDSHLPTTETMVDLCSSNAVHSATVCWSVS